jgi:hypothetical protein
MTQSLRNTENASPDLARLVERPAEAKDVELDRLQQALTQEQKARNQERFLWLLGMIIVFDAAVFPHVGWGIPFITIFEILFILLAAEKCDIEGIIPALRNAIDLGNRVGGRKNGGGGSP